MKNYKQFNESGIVNIPEFSSGESVIFPYIRNQRVDLIPQWVKDGGDINIRNFSINGNTFTPLMQAVADHFEEHVNMVDLIISLGADLNIKDEWGRTALWYASYNGHYNSVLLLLKAGADPYIKNSNGRDFYDVLPGNDSIRKAISDWLEENNPTYIHSKRFDL